MNPKYKLRPAESISLGKWGPEDRVDTTLAPKTYNVPDTAGEPWPKS
jgi:hypothetical protein